MLARSLVAFMSVGVVSALLFGMYLDGVRNAAPQVVDGPSVTIMPERGVYAPGEEVAFLIANTGTVNLQFEDSSLGWSVTDLSGIGIYEPDRSRNAQSLGPGEHAGMVWGQTNGSGEQVPDGIYKIVVESPRASATVTISR
ncbi:MAG: hypothetical protein EB830_01050 [Nitrosopumilus sp. H13]|nr:MAG: hypothetical protein EB830_01050 [Nitrosopumilus sp. H13]